MPTKDPIAAARREAKARARKGGITHQQALDAIAREAGHAGWAEMSAAPAKTDATDHVREYVMRLRPHGGIPPTDETRALVEDAIHGYLAEPDGADITAYVDSYEFRGDGFDLTPDAFQRDIVQTAIEGFMADELVRRGLRGPAHLLGYQMDELDYLRPPGIDPDLMPVPVSLGKPVAAGQLPSLAEVEQDVHRLMARQRAEGATGLSISDWVSARMRAAAERGLARIADAKPLARLAELPMTSANVAYAIDPDRGPYDDEAATLTVRCPLHGKDGPERNPSLVISGMTMRCMAGCSPDDLSSKLVERICEAGEKARAFMHRNDRSAVYTGSANDERRGGMGGTYGLEDRSFHRMDTLTMRLLPDGYPRWNHDSSEEEA